MEWNVWNPTSADSMKVGKVIGVVKDFNFKSLYDKVEPAVLQIFPNAAYKVAVKVESKGIENTLAQVEKTWSRLIPDYPLEYQFLDENFERMYTSEDKLNSLLWVFTSLAIFIGCLHGGKKKKRNWYKKGFGSFGKWYRIVAFERFCPACDSIFDHCLSDSLLLYASMATGLCLQN
jgi:hypothetical protein